MSAELSPARLAEIRERAGKQAAAYDKMLELGGGVGMLGVRCPEMFEDGMAWDRSTENDHADTALALLDHIDTLAATIERVRALHKPVMPVFNWQEGLRFEEPCEHCHGKAGVHACGCWADEDAEFECLECAQPKGGGSRRVMPWPCPTIKALEGADRES